MAAHQAPLSVGFSRQEHWSGLPFPSPMQESESEVTQSCLTLHDPMDCSLPGSSIHGIFWARVLEGGAIAFSSSILVPCNNHFIISFLHICVWTYIDRINFYEMFPHNTLMSLICNKYIFLHNHSTVIKFRKFSIGTILIYSSHSKLTYWPSNILSSSHPSNTGSDPVLIPNHVLHLTLTSLQFLLI